MLKEIRIQNFLSFKDEVVSLDKKQNILIGINGSGKTNLLKAIKLLKEGVAGMGLKKYVIDILGAYDSIHFKDNTTVGTQSAVVLEYVFDGASLSTTNFQFDTDVHYTIELHKLKSTNNYFVKETIKDSSNHIYLHFDNGVGYLGEHDRDAANYNQIRLVGYHDFIDGTALALSKVFDTDRYFILANIRKSIEHIQVYNYFDTAPDSAMRRAVLPTSEQVLAPDGTNLTQILNTIKINHKASYARIVSMLNDVNQKFKGLDFNFVGGRIELMLEESGLDSAVHVAHVSDGTLRFLCLLAILLNPAKGRIICIDEPEIGLHPDMIATVGRALTEASESSTMVVSTHSEAFLNCFEIDKIRVFEKDEDNASNVSSYTNEDFAGWYKEYSTGKMWRDGDFGGNRW